MVYSSANSCQRQIYLLMFSSRLSAHSFYPSFKIITNLEGLTVVAFKIAESKKVKIDLTLSLKTAKPGEGAFRTASFS